MKRHIRPKNVVQLPKGSELRPMGATGLQRPVFDIVKQTKVIATYIDTKYVVYSDEPFTIRIKVNGKQREFSSKLRG